jgi:hypothetical protein
LMTLKEDSQKELNNTKNKGKSMNQPTGKQLDKHQIEATDAWIERILINHKKRKLAELGGKSKSSRR